MTSPEHGCACRPAWPALVVHAEDGDVAVAPFATPGGLACLYRLAAEAPIADPHPNDGGR